MERRWEPTDPKKMEGHVLEASPLTKEQAQMMAGLFAMALSQTLIACAQKMGPSSVPFMAQLRDDICQLAFSAPGMEKFGDDDIVKKMVHDAIFYSWPKFSV